MFDGECLVFVEVRYRRRSGFASAAASVDLRKQRKLALTAASFLSRKRRFADCAVRFDVLAIDERSDGHAEMTWIRDAFRPGF